MEILDRYRGGMLGVPVGDALGLPFETKSASKVDAIISSDPKLRELKGRLEMIGAFDWFHFDKTGEEIVRSPGMYSDDGAMTLALATSIVENGFDPKDQFERYQDWFLNLASSLVVLSQLYVY